MNTTHITLNPADTFATINPNIYGHFTEHLGRCIYDGIWVGEDSPIPNIGGFRTDIIEALRRLRPPVIRWPGGCFSDDYHWQSGAKVNQAHGQILAREIHAHNTFSLPTLVIPQAFEVSSEPSGLHLTLPPASVAAVQVKLS